MKNYCTLLLTFITSFLIAQDCLPTTAGIEVIQNRYKQNILLGNNASNELYYVAEDHPSGSIDLRRYASLSYSSNIWVSGRDQNGNMQFAGAKYETDGKSDWFPGPLQEDGSPLEEGCEYWDQIFQFTKKEVLDHYYSAFQNGVFDQNYNCDDIPENILNWPGTGNPLITNLPDGQLADFLDYNKDGIYNPCDGDLPFVSIDNCENEDITESIPYLPEQAAFWIRNDANRSNGLTNAAPIGLQLHSYTFNYATHDNQSSIYWKYDLFNKGNLELDDLRFSQWLDFDLGCNVNDYIGCDVQRGMVYTYNKSEIDIEDGCEGGVNSFSDEIPMFGYSFLRGLRYFNEVDEFQEYGLNSVYIPANCSVAPDPKLCEPSQDISEYFNASRGLYLDGSEIENPQGETTTYMYPDDPNDPNGWSLCTDNSTTINTSVIMSTGGELAKLYPGQRQQVVIGGYISENEAYPCPDLTNLKNAKDRAIILYHDCSFQFDGPTAPNLDVQLDDTGMNIYIDNSFLGSNNEGEGYIAEDRLAPPHLDVFYNFEGYKIYQVGSADFDLTLIDDPAYSKLVYQGDLENEAADLYNWELTFGDSNMPYQKELKVEGSNMGIDQPIRLEKDFLSNEEFDYSKDYHYVAIAYAYNNWQDFDTSQYSGQRTQYVESSRNIKVSTSRVINSVQDPMPNLPWKIENKLNSFSISEINSDLSIDLFSYSGQALKKWKVNDEVNFASRDLSIDLLDGVYFVFISAMNGDRQTIKIVVMN